MIILQREGRQLKLTRHCNRLLWAYRLAGTTPNTAVEAELGFLFGLSFGGFNHFDGASGAVAAAEPAASTFFNVMFDVAAEAFGADSFLERVADCCGFSFEDGAKEFALHCSWSWHFFSHSLWGDSDEGEEPVHYPWPGKDYADHEEAEGDDPFPAGMDDLVDAPTGEEGFHVGEDEDEDCGFHDEPEGVVNTSDEWVEQPGHKLLDVD